MGLMAIVSGPSCVGKSTLGDARRTLLAVAAWLSGEEPSGAEQWEPGLLP